MAEPTARGAYPLAIDARPRGPRGALAGETVGGRTVLDRLLELAAAVAPGEPAPVVHASAEDAASIASLGEGRFVTSTGMPAAGAAVLRTDRLYDPARLRKALGRGNDPETAAFWRLDRPAGLAGAGDELARRQGYQPIGKYWALDPARWVARSLAPTRVRPNAVTLAAAALMLGASALVAMVTPSWPVNVAAALAMAAALVLDTADGHLARLQGTASEFGRFLDAWLDELCDMALHAAVAWSAYARAGHAGWLLAGMAYGMGKYVFSVGSVEVKAASAGEPATELLRNSPARAAVRLAGHADVRWHLWIALAAVGRLDAALAVYATYFPARAAFGIASKAREARRA